MSGLNEVETILRKLKSYGLTDRQIANSIGVNRVSINRLRNGKPNKGETGVSYLPDLRKLLAEVEQQSSEITPMVSNQVSRSNHQGIVIAETVESKLREIVEKPTKPYTQKASTQDVPSRPIQQPLPSPICSACGTQNVKLYRKPSEEGMGGAFVFVCKTCLHAKSKQGHMRQQTGIPSTMTKQVIPWGQVFRRKDT